MLTLLVHRWPTYNVVSRTLLAIFLIACHFVFMYGKRLP